MIKGMCGKHYEKIRELCDNARETRKRLSEVEYQSVKDRIEVDRIDMDMIAAECFLNSYATSYAAQLDKCVYILKRLKKIPILRSFIKKMEES